MLLLWAQICTVSIALGGPEVMGHSDITQVKNSTLTSFFICNYYFFFLQEKEQFSNSKNVRSGIKLLAAKSITLLHSSLSNPVLLNVDTLCKHKILLIVK